MSDEEHLLIVFLAGLASDPIDLTDLSSTPVWPMNDGYMGGLRIGPRVPESALSIASSAEGEDGDGVSLSIALFIDSQRRPRELDIWKVDFTRLLRLPQPDTLRPVPAS